MTIQQFVEAIENDDVLVTVVDDESVVLRFYPNGSEGLSAELKAREIDKINVDNANRITVKVKAL